MRKHGGVPGDYGGNGEGSGHCRLGHELLLEAEEAEQIVDLALAGVEATLRMGSGAEAAGADATELSSHRAAGGASCLIGYLAVSHMGIVSQNGEEGIFGARGQTRMRPAGRTRGKRNPQPETRLYSRTAFPSRPFWNRIMWVTLPVASRKNSTCASTTFRKNFDSDSG